MAFRIPLLTKARGQAPKGGRDIAPIVAALTAAQQQMTDASVRTLPRPQQWFDALFGPGIPIPYGAIDKPGADGLPEPRQNQYPVWWNVPGSGERAVEWETLKKAAETPLFRACIEIRKNEISCLDWSVTVSKSVIAQKSKDENKPKQDIENDLRQQYKADIKKAMDFLSMPDRRNGRDFAAWVALLLEEHLKWDAMVIYPRKTYGGELLDLMLVDGSTIKPLLDEQGGRPEPPYPAYQQLLYGFPRSEFTADTARTADGDVYVPGAFSSSQLIYERRVQRLETPYGYSPTEQALLDGLLWNKRFAWMMAEYTEGAQPVQWIINKGTTDWTAQQLLEYERLFNDRYSGKTSSRYRNPFLPEGLEPVQTTQVPDKYKPDYDLFIIKLVASHFDVTMAELGFTEPGGLGSSGYHEGQADVQYRKATLPTSRWIASLITRILHQHLGIADELEFCFLGLEDEDEAAADQVATSRVQRGSMTVNEDRQRIGLPPYPFREANEPMLQTARGIVFMQGASEMAPPGVLVEPQSVMIPGNGADPNATGVISANDNRPAIGTPGANVLSGATPGQRARMAARAGPAGQTGASRGGLASKSEAVDEIARYRRWCARHTGPDRRFRFDAVDVELAKELAPDLLDDSRALLKAADQQDPKAPSGQGGQPISPWRPASSPWSAAP